MLLLVNRNVAIASILRSMIFRSAVMYDLKSPRKLILSYLRHLPNIRFNLAFFSRDFANSLREKCIVMTSYRPSFVSCGYACVCMYVAMYVGTYVCMFVRIDRCIYEYTYVLVMVCIFYSRRSGRESNED